MAISYSGIVNYGKATLPSVESWGTNMNILRDPPKSITTRKIDKVGETSAITQSIADSGDRYCEAINYYPRGVNPMVSVNYSDGQRLNSLTSKGEAFLPYRIIRDGAFRPPIWRQEDLLPLSRMPRIWTEVNTQPYAPIYTLRIKNCGTAETTREVKSKLLKTECATVKTISAYPDINAPDIINRSIVIDPLAPGQITAQRSCVGANDSENRKRYAMGPVLLAPSRPIASGFTNRNMVKEHPIALNNIKLLSNHPTAQAFTNLSAPSTQGSLKPLPSGYDRLPTRLNRGEYPTRPGIPSVTMNHPGKPLIRVR